MAEVDKVVHTGLEACSGLLEQVGQLVPHLVALLVGPQADPDALPLGSKTTNDLIKLLEFGWLLSEVATIWNVDREQLVDWIASDRQRIARTRLARKAQAEIWDRVAFVIGLCAPSNSVEMTRARLLMDHCKWRAGMYSPDDYVRRVSVKKAVEDKDERKLTNAELQVIARGGAISDEA